MPNFVGWLVCLLLGKYVLCNISHICQQSHSQVFRIVLFLLLILPMSSVYICCCSVSSSRFFFVGKGLCLAWATIYLCLVRLISLSKQKLFLFIWTFICSLFCGLFYDFAACVWVSVCVFLLFCFQHFVALHYIMTFVISPTFQGEMAGGRGKLFSHSYLPSWHR